MAPPSRRAEQRCRVGAPREVEEGGTLAGTCTTAPGTGGVCVCVVCASRWPTVYGLVLFVVMHVYPLHVHVSYVCCDGRRHRSPGMCDFTFFLWFGAESTLQMDSNNFYRRCREIRSYIGTADGFVRPEPR
eukprot:5406249-Prymnesium_polylepis.1